VVFLLVIVGELVLIYAMNKPKVISLLPATGLAFLADPTYTPTVTPTFTDTPTPTPTPTPDNNNFDSAYDYPVTAQGKGTVRIPVLTYHHINALPKSITDRPYFVTPEMFDRQMAYLKEKNYRSLSMQEYFDQLKSGKNPTQKSVLITFDDSDADQYKYGFPTLQKYGFIGTFAIISAKSGITPAQLREMSAAGMDIASHSKYHEDLAKLDDDGVLNDEIANSRYDLQARTGEPVIAIIYPGCTADGQAIGHVKAAGYSLGFTCGKSIDNRFSQRYILNRMHVYSNFENFKQRLSGIWIVTNDYE
jgi:peptidoglycan/xylan/chitin deacetylase (PgdA/CDA1 family)